MKLKKKILKKGIRMKRTKSIKNITSSMKIGNKGKGISYIINIYYIIKREEEEIREEEIESIRDELRDKEG